MHRDERKFRILMYHSISDGVGPSCIAPHLFRQQMVALADCGYHAVALADFAAWARGERELAARSMVVTFDDGFDDFATAAFPELQDRGWTATVSLPAGKVGSTSDWAAPVSAFPVQPLMTWKTVAELARRGVEFGAHEVTHADLTALSPEAARREIVHSKLLIEDNTGFCIL